MDATAEEPSSIEEQRWRHASYYRFATACRIARTTPGELESFARLGLITFKVTGVDAERVLSVGHIVLARIAKRISDIGVGHDDVRDTLTALPSSVGGLGGVTILARRGGIFICYSDEELRSRMIPGAGLVPVSPVRIANQTLLDLQSHEDDVLPETDQSYDVNDLALLDEFNRAVGRPIIESARRVLEASRTRASWHAVDQDLFGQGPSAEDLRRTVQWNLESAAVARYEVLRDAVHLDEFLAKLAIEAPGPLPETAVLTLSAATGEPYAPLWQLRLLRSDVGVEVLRELCDAFGDDVVALSRWVIRPQEGLDLRSPLEAIGEGEVERVRGMLGRLKYLVS